MVKDESLKYVVLGVVFSKHYLPSVFKLVSADMVFGLTLDIHGKLKIKKIPYNIIERYNFDRKLRLILFDAIERIEVSLRTKMIYYMSLQHGGMWYLENNLFENKLKEFNGIRKTVHLHTLDELNKEFSRSKEVFIKDHIKRHPNKSAEAVRCV